MDLILLGAPGAGKGTQGALLAERMGVPKIATGDMLRDALRQGTTLGQEAKRYMDAGELVPDSVVLGLVREALTKPEARTGAIFDGYPRNVAQGESLGGLLDEIGRRTDPETGAVYHLEHAPPPAEIAERLVQRPDDQEETVRNRLSVYRQTTAPLVAFYESAGVPVHHVDGTRPIEQVQGEIMQLLGR